MAESLLGRGWGWLKGTAGAAAGYISTGARAVAETLDWTQWRIPFEPGTAEEQRKAFREEVKESEKFWKSVEEQRISGPPAEAKEKARVTGWDFVSNMRSDPTEARFQRAKAFVVGAANDGLITYAQKQQFLRAFQDPLTAKQIQPKVEAQLQREDYAGAYHTVYTAPHLSDDAQRKLGGQITRIMGLPPEMTPPANNLELMLRLGKEALMLAFDVPMQMTQQGLRKHREDIANIGFAIDDFNTNLEQHSVLWPLAIASPLPLLSDSLIQSVSGHYGQGPVTDETWGEVIAAARYGKRIVPEYIETAMKRLPDDATPAQRSWAIAGGLMDNIVTDPVGMVLASVDVLPRLGASVNRARDAVLVGGIRKFGLSHDEAVAVARAMRVMTEDPSFDMVAFSNKGIGTNVFRETISDALHQGGRGVAREYADDIARYATGTLQNKTRRTLHWFDRELVPRGFLEDPTNIKADRVEWIFEAAEAGIPKRIPRLATEVEAARPTVEAAARRTGAINVDEIERIAEARGLAVHEVEAAKALADAVVEEAAHSGNDITRIISGVKRNVLARGDLPAEMDVPLRSIVNRSETVERNWGAFLAQPVADLSAAEKTTITRYLAHYPREVKSAARASELGMEVGDVWGATAIERLKILYAEAGLNPNEAVRAMHGEEVLAKKLPGAVRKLYVAGEDFAKRMVLAREEIERMGYEIGDEGFGYVTRLPVTRPVSGMRTEQSISSGSVRVMQKAGTEHPGWAPLTRVLMGEHADDIVDLAAAEKQVANWSTDLNNVSRTYSAFMGHLKMHSELVPFAKQYGIPRSAIASRVITTAERAAAQKLSPDILDQAMRGEGWEPLIRRVTDTEARHQGLETLTDLGENYIRDASQSLNDYYLPKGVAPYLERQLERISPMRAELNKWFSLHRMAGINSPTFLQAQLFEQGPNVSQARAAEKFAQGARLSTALMGHDMAKLAEASIGSTVRNWIRARGWSKASTYPLVEDLYFRGLSDPVNIARVRDLALKVGIEPETVARQMKFVLDNDILHSGPIQALNIGKETGKMIGDEALRSTLGFAMRWIGGPMEGFARTASAFSLKLQGLSDPDTLRQLARGFVPYESSARGPIDNAAQLWAYYWQYNARKPFQTARWFMERPVWLWAHHRAAQSLYDGLLNDRERLMIQGRTSPNQLRPSVLPWSWDAPPFSWYNVSDDLKNAALPNLALRTPGLEAIPDWFRYIGVTEKGIAPGKGMFQSSHPLVRAAGSILQDPSDWKGALRVMVPHTFKYFGVDVRPLNRENLDKMYKWQGVSLNPPQGSKNPDGSPVSLVQWRTHYDKLFTEMRDLQDTMNWPGFMTRIDLKGPLVKQMPPDAMDSYNEMRRAEGEPPFLYSTHQSNIIRKTYADAGFTPPPPSDINAVVQAGGNPSGYAMRGAEMAREAREVQMSFKDWQLVAKQRIAAGGAPTPLPTGALTELMQLGAEHDITFKPEELQQLAQQSYPSSLPAINKFFTDYYHQPEDGVRFREGYCAETFGDSIEPVIGKGIRGHANQWPGLLLKQGWQEVDAPQSGDAYYTKTFGGQYGHIGWVVPDPETGEPVAMSNLAGAKKGIMQPLPKGRYFRPPPVTGVELYLKQLKLQH